jgi:hypothetical protein
MERPPESWRPLLAEVAARLSVGFPSLAVTAAFETTRPRLLHFGGRAYPPITGHVLTANDYPFSYMHVDDGIAELRLGLRPSEPGRDATVRFCPRYPELIPELSTPESVLRVSQRSFFAFDEADPTPGAMRAFDLEDARADGTLAMVGGIVSLENQTVYPGIHRPGIPVVTFAALRSGIPFPLPKLLSALIEEVASRCPDDVMRVDVAILPAPPDSGEPHGVVLETMAPVRSRLDEVERSPRDVVILSHLVMGHGERHVQDVVFVDRDTFDPARTREIAVEIALHNERLTSESRPYVLIGPGRWGSTDPWLGIPVRWSDVSGACVQVEVSDPKLQAEPSRGMHFFREIVTRRVICFYAGSEATADLVDWPRLGAWPLVNRTEHVKHVRAPHPLALRANAREQTGHLFS